MMARPCARGSYPRPAMALTILLVSHPLLPVGPDSAGEVEQIISRIDDVLADAGHRAILVAPEGTLCRGDLVVTPAIEGPHGERERERARDHHRRAIARECCTSAASISSP